MVARVLLCRDCAYFDPATKLCGHESAQAPLDYITGERKPNYYAQVMRECEGVKMCGAVARHFVPKPGSAYVSRDRNELEQGAGGSLVRAGE